MEEEKIENLLMYEPSDKDRNLINKLYLRLQKMSQMRSNAMPYANNKSLIGYINDSMNRWNGIIPPKDDLSLDWEPQIFNNFTHNVVLAFLSKVAMHPPKARFTATNQKGFQDTLRAHILEKGIEYTRNRENAEWKFLLAALEMVTKGTVIVYEGYRKIKRKVKEIKNYDPITGKVDSEEKEILDYNDCFQDVIPLEEIYIGNTRTNDIQNQPDIIWKRILSKQSFNEEFKKYPNYKYVKPGSYASVIDAATFYNVKDSQLTPNSVEVLDWYNKQKDRLVRMANGVILYDGPIPFTHKKYPFAHGIFEPFATDAFYGRSLPDKIASDQDITNTFWRMMVTQNLLSIYKPILTDDPDYIQEYPLQAGRMFPVSDITKYKVMNELTGPDNSQFQMLQLALKFANDNSGGILGAQGPNPGKGKMTARQALLMEEQAKQALGLNVKTLEAFDIQCLNLRTPNFLQFYPSQDKAQSITGEDSSKGQFLRVLRIDNTELSDGTHGTSIIKIARNTKALPSQGDLNTEEEVASMQGDNIEVHAITPEYIRNVAFDVQIVGDSSYQQSKSLRQAMGTEFYQLALANPLINQEENTREWVKLNDKDEDKMVQKPQQQPQGQGQPQGGQPGQDQGGQTPQLANQIIGGNPMKSLESMR